MEGFDFLSGLEDLKDDVRTTYKHDNNIDPSEYSPEDIEFEVDSFILDDENRDKDGRDRDDNDDEFVEEKEEVEEDIEEEFPDNIDSHIGKSRSFEDFEDENSNHNQKKKENKDKINESKRRRKIKNLEEQNEKEKIENKNKKIKEEKKINKNKDRKDEKKKADEKIKENKNKNNKNSKENKKDEKTAMKELLNKAVKKENNNKDIDKKKPLYEQIKEKKEDKKEENNKKVKNKNEQNKNDNKRNNKSNNKGNSINKENNRNNNKGKNKNEKNKDKKVNKNKIDKKDKRYILYKNGLYVDKKTGESLTLDELKEIVYSDQDMSIKDEKGKIYDKDKSHNKEYKDELINKIKKNKDKDKKNKEIKNDNIDRNKDEIEDENRTKTVIQKGIPVVSSGKKKDNEKKKEELKKIFDDGEEKEKSLVVSEAKTEDDIFVEEALESRKKRPKPPIENTFIAEIFLVVEELFENLRFYKLSPATMYKKVLEEDISPADILAHIITASFLGSGLVNVLSHLNILGRSDGVINSMATRKIRFAFTIIAIAPMLKLLLIALLGSVFNIKRDDDRDKYRDTFKYIIINSYSKFLLIFLFNIISVFAPAISIVVLIPIVLKGGLKDIFNVSGIFKKRDVSDLELTIYITLYYVIILAILRHLYLF